MEYVEHRLSQESLQSAQSPPTKTAASSTTAILTPLNLILTTALLYTIYKAVSPPANKYADLAPPTAPTVFRTYTPRTLLPFNGKDSPQIYLAVRGRVFDVSRGASFYGPEGPYANFAGRDASRGLALGSFDPDVLTDDLDGPLDTLHDLDASELDALAGWEERFSDKYHVVGRLVSVDDFKTLGKDGAA
ncbi:hypothetical protein L249_5937 [Ophiocordyceps polyrhachis-furcata BCC 54312]|uniref:Cytochrome b5 heme-binding domain-containing protein n=1 Tax=Ophiocordyceps polyrhachis-furcata BCC 54312 TaxID=1330021 RepID=A0A367LIP5_9HYPO|nr:hypothetical protein L249_5937 [Ophiocordyceps polyrhachis-furcata BCC 54312]